MAGSRVEKFRTIYARMNGIIKSGAVKYENRPLWYDLYERFPPKYEPCSDRPVVDKEIVNIVYQEDIIRAEFYKKFRSPGLIDLKNQKSKTICQIFVEEYNKLKGNGDVPEDQLFDSTVESLNSQGIVLNQK